MTGTDTDIGKSAVTAALAAALRHRGARVVATKPIASGVAPGSEGEDAELLGKAAGHPPWNRYRYPDPLSPHRAQERAGATVDLDALIDELLSIEADHVLVEAAGGWRAPLGRDSRGALFEARDLARRLHAVPILVTADRLGCLHQTRVTAEVMTADGHPPAWIVLNRGIGVEDASRAINRDDLVALLPMPIIPFGTLHAWNFDELSEAGAPIAQALQAYTRAL